MYPVWRSPDLAPRGPPPEPDQALPPPPGGSAQAAAPHAARRGPAPDQALRQLTSRACRRLPAQPRARQGLPGVGGRAMGFWHTLAVGSRHTLAAHAPALRGRPAG